MTQLGIDWSAPAACRTEAREALTSDRLRADHSAILACLANGPLTDAEILAATGINPNAVRARRGELVTQGLVVPCGKRQGASGRLMTTWGLA